MHDDLNASLWEWLQAVLGVWCLWVFAWHLSELLL